MAQGFVGRTLGKHRQTLDNLTVTQGRESYAVRPVDATDMPALEFGREPVIPSHQKLGARASSDAHACHHTIDDSPKQICSSTPLKADVGGALDGMIDPQMTAQVCTAAHVVAAA